MAVIQKSSKKKVSKLKKLGKLFNPRSLKGGMALFALVFALAGGGYYVYSSFASTVLTTAMVKTADNKGYYLLEVNGGLMHYGSAAHRGSPNKDGVSGQTFVDMALTSSGAGYWILAESGRVYNYGDASKSRYRHRLARTLPLYPHLVRGFGLSTNSERQLPTAMPPQRIS